MKHIVIIEIPKTDSITIELDDSISPKLVSNFIHSLPFTTKANVWGDEIYTDPVSFLTEEKNAKTTVDLFDVAFWPPGKAVCLFYGPTPISTKQEIKPYSEVNILGKIINPDKSILSKIIAGTKFIFRSAKLS